VPASRGSSPPPSVITRGTTGPQRLRRVDRWLTGTQAARLGTAPDPLVVDLGYGARPWTTVELAQRLRRVRPDVEVVGVEVDPARVAIARAEAGEPGVRFVHGGFDLGPALAGRHPCVIRALNVLRQYDEAAVATAWEALAARLAPGGLLVEGTCSELGRLAGWVVVPAGSVGSVHPVSLVLGAQLATLDRPSRLAERLPRALVQRNVPGEGVHALLTDLDEAWERAAAYAVYGPRQRWVQAVGHVAQRWPVQDGAARWRLGELSVAWAAVAPRAA